MGDRRQVKFEDMGIWYYTHWGGCKLIEDLKKAIRKAKSRWDDESYCLRIILSQLIGNDWDSETGHGISNQYLDSEHEDPIVNIRENLVKFEGKEMSFSEFIGEEIPKTTK